MSYAERRASLRVAHSRGCPNVNLSALSSVERGSGCTCTPRYFTFHRSADGRSVKGERVLNRQVAERALRALQVKLDEGAVDLQRPDTRSFTEWADTFTAEVAPGRATKGSTRRAYDTTVKFATAAFGAVTMRSIGPAELRRLVALIRANGSGDATVSKHLRQLGAIFQAAEDEGLIPRNPVPKFKKGLRLRVPRGDEAFTDVELSQLWTALARRERQPVILALCKTAVTTGARQGELIAADVDDLSLLEGRLDIRRHFDPIDGLGLPKDNEPRTLYLIPPARRVLEAWLTIRGDEPGPLFPAPRGERLNGSYVTRLLRLAMSEAGIPSEAENGKRRKPFHAFRACYTRLCREQGRDLQWVQGQLGHSSADLTVNTYGRWSDDAIAAEAAKVPEDSFPV